MPRPIRFCAVLISLCLSLFTDRSHAATYCVGSVAELRSAVQAAMTNPGDDEIRIRQGVYAIDATIILTTAQPGWLSIIGGYSAGNGLPCGAFSGNARSTVLSGGGLRQILVIGYVPGDASTSGARYLFTNFTLRDGAGSGFERGGGLNVSMSGANADNELWIDNLYVAGNSGYFAGGINAFVAYGMVRVTNSHFDNNSAPGTSSAHLAIVANAAHPAYTRAVVIANSTFTRGRCAGSAGIGYTRGCGVGVGLAAPLKLEVANSVFFDNQINDLSVEGSVGAPPTEQAFISRSQVPIYNGTVAYTVSGAISAAPLFVDPANGNFRLRENSPLVNSGALPLPGNYPALNGYDLDGNQRVRLGTVDVGAYELQQLEAIFAGSFEP